MLTWVCVVLVGLGLLQALLGLQQLRLLAQIPVAAPRPGLPVSILKPLCGSEPLLEAGLASVCMQDWPEMEIICGVQDPADPAIAVVRRLQARFPARRIILVVDPTWHGTNRKVGNLINMLKHAQHEILVFADSDMHVSPDWLTRVVTALEQPGVGLVTTLYSGLPAAPGWIAKLGALQITQIFLPGAVLARVLGRQICLGATMALRRTTLVQTGGLESLADQLADDALLGIAVSQAGLRVELAPSIPATTVPERHLADLWRHELRWARTIRSLAPAGHAASVLQYSLFWAWVALLLSGGAGWAVGLFAATWALRGAIALALDGASSRLGVASHSAIWLLPVRDPISVAVLAVSFAGRQVAWRGHMMQAAPVQLAEEG